ncbi:MAG: exodeoxyribonuclease III [Deltaproteobacteria bacterium]|nr:exodeoxyribonuclease III [Deltaproteobacteria bacterium]
MRIATWNVNGLRAALRKGLPDHLEALRLDALMMQEVRSLPEQLPAPWRQPVGWEVVWHPAEKRGYAGTATWARQELVEVGRGLGGEEDPEGRVLVCEVGGVRLINVYLPSGSASEERQARKEAWMARFLPWAAAQLSLPLPVLLAGDLNIAHTPLDIHNATGNKRNSGFLPHEREWFSALLSTGWRDLLREQEGPVQGPYSWWSNRGRARELNRGWRIDYLLGNDQLAAQVQRVWVHREGGLAVSDHAPVVVDLGEGAGG